MFVQFLYEFLYYIVYKSFFFPQLKKRVLQYVATQSSFILRTMAFLPPVLHEGLWVVGDEKRESPAATTQQSPANDACIHFCHQHVLKVIFLNMKCKFLQPLKAAIAFHSANCCVPADAVSSPGTSLPLNSSSPAPRKQKELHWRSLK